MAEYLNFVAKIHRMPEYPWQYLNFRGTGQHACQRASCPLPLDLSHGQAADLRWLGFSGKGFARWGARLPVNLSHFAVGRLVVPGMVRDIWQCSVLVRQVDLAGRRCQRAGYPVAPRGSLVSPLSSPHSQ